MASSRFPGLPATRVSARRRALPAAALACLRLAAVLFPLAPAAAVNLSFGTFSLESGTDKQVGAVYRFDDVETGFDALLSIDGFSAGAGISKIDDATGPTAEGKFEYLQPVVEGIASDGDYADFTITFVLADTSTPVSISDFKLRAQDVDGNNVDGNSYEFLILNEFDAYTVENPTNINPNVLSLSPVSAKFTSILNGGPPGITLDPEYAVEVDYTDISSLTFRLGLEGTRTTLQGRQFALNMFDDPDPFIDPQTTLVPEPGTAFLCLVAGMTTTFLARRCR